MPSGGMVKVNQGSKDGNTVEWPCGSPVGFEKLFGFLLSCSRQCLFLSVNPIIMLIPEVVACFTIDHSDCPERAMAFASPL